MARTKKRTMDIDIMDVVEEEVKDNKSDNKSKKKSKATSDSAEEAVVDNAEGTASADFDELNETLVRMSKNTDNSVDKNRDTRSNLEIMSEFLSKKNIYFESCEEDNYITMKFSVDNGIFLLVADFDDPDSTCVKVLGLELFKVPNEPTEALYQVLNECNARYKFVRMYYNDSTKSVVAQCDGVITKETCADVTYEIMMRVANVVDSAYSDIMRAIWS